MSVHEKVKILYGYVVSTKHLLLNVKFHRDYRRHLGYGASESDRQRFEDLSNAVLQTYMVEALQYPDAIYCLCRDHKGFNFIYRMRIGDTIDDVLEQLRAAVAHMFTAFYGESCTFQIIDLSGVPE